MAKAPTPGTTSTSDAGSFRIGYDGNTWLFSVSEVTPRDVAALRQATGMTPKTLFSVDLSDMDLDVAAGMIFLARRQSESRQITFDAATAGLSYESDMTFEVVGSDGEDADGGDDHPEA